MILIGNLVNWTVCTVFTLQSNIALLAVGMLIWMTLMPAIEAAEQTVLQRVVPVRSSGSGVRLRPDRREAASPLTAFLIGPLAQLVFIPFMTDGAGVDLIGSWFGTGERTRAWR